MFNDFKGYDKDFNKIEISIPPTLLISSIGVMNDITKAVTIDFKFPHDLIYLIGLTENETGGSEYNAYMGEKIQGTKFIGNNVPKVDSDLSKKIYKAMETAIDERLIDSCISVERGGLAVALAKSSLAGMIGCEIKLSKVKSSDRLRSDIILFSESQGRFLVSINPNNKDKFDSLFSTLPCSCIGSTTNGASFKITGVDDRKIINTDILNIEYNYRKKLKKY
jgi:phosphoribosylformylglycinamidine synthase